MSDTKYYAEYSLTGNSILQLESNIHINKNTGNVAIGTPASASFKFLVTGDTYSEQYYMRTPDTGTANDFLIYESGKIKKKTGGGSTNPGGVNYNVQYFSGGTLTGTSALDFQCQKRLKVTDVFQIAPMSDLPSSDGACFSPEEGDIVRLKDSIRNNDGYYVFNGSNWVAVVTW